MIQRDPSPPFAHNPNHAEDGILKFAAPFWGKPRWAALFVAIARQIQELEDTARDVLEKRTIANAIGAQLAVLGGIVGQLDPGLGEEVFRNLIRVRVRVNRSSGTCKDLIEVLNLFGIPLERRKLTNDSPSQMRLEVIAPLPVPIAMLAQTMNETAATGVGVDLVYDPDGGSGFAYSNNTLVGTGNNIFSNDSFDGAGSWAGVWNVP